MIVDDILASELNSIAEHHIEANLDILHQMIQDNEPPENMYRQMLLYIAWYKLFTDTNNG